VRQTLQIQHDLHRPTIDRIQIHHGVRVVLDTRMQAAQAADIRHVGLSPPQRR
jgi:hypothetical protein